MNPNQTAPAVWSGFTLFIYDTSNSLVDDKNIHFVWSGSTMFAFLLMLNRHFQMQLFCWRILLNNDWGGGTRWYSYFWIKPTLLFSFYLCVRLTSPNYAFMRRRLYRKRKSSNKCNASLYVYLYHLYCCKVHLHLSKSQLDRYNPSRTSNALPFIITSMPPYD